MARLVDNSGDAASNLVTGDGTNSLTFPMPGNLALDVESVVATVDNAGGGDTLATLTVRDQSGVVIATKRQSVVVPAGDTGTATWARRLTDETPSAASAVAWLRGQSLQQFGGGTSIAAGANGVAIFDNLWDNPDETIFETDDFGGTPLGFVPKRSGLYGVWIASQWDVAAFDKMIGFQSPLADGLFNGRNSNSVANYASFLLAGLSTATTIACVNKNLAAVTHNVASSFMTAVYYGVH